VTKSKKKKSSPKRPGRVGVDLVSKQREERKQRILDVARSLIADRGYDGVTMRDLAGKSLVSVPTLYNLFGGKNELLSAAVESYFFELIGSAGRAGTEQGLSRLISLAEMIGRETLCHAAYARSLMGSFGGPSDTGGLHEFVTRGITDEVVEALEEMQLRRQLVAWADVCVLGERLASQFIIISFEWASRHLSDEGLQAALLYSVGVLLLGLARGETAAELERLVRKSQAAAAVPGQSPRSRNLTGKGEN
jgi:AcrR family transcriptional regulator